MARGRIILREVAQDGRIHRYGEEFGPLAVIFRAYLTAWWDVNAIVPADPYWIKANVLSLFNDGPLRVTLDDCRRFAAGLVKHGLAVIFEAEHDHQRKPFLHHPTLADEQINWRRTREPAEWPVPPGFTTETCTLPETFRTPAGYLPEVLPHLGSWGTFDATTRRAKYILDGPVVSEHTNGHFAPVGESTKELVAGSEVAAFRNVAGKFPETFPPIRYKEEGRMETPSESPSACSEEHAPLCNEGAGVREPTKAGGAQTDQPGQTDQPPGGASSGVPATVPEPPPPPKAPIPTGGEPGERDPDDERPDEPEGDGPPRRRKRRSPATAGASGESPAFCRAWAVYPHRGTGESNPRGMAWDQWRSRVRKDGVPEEDLERATRGYAAACDAAGKTGTSLVMQGKTFYGPNRRWEEFLTESAAVPGGVVPVVPAAGVKAQPTGGAAGVRRGYNPMMDPESPEFQARMQ